MNFHTLNKINNSPEETLLAPKIYYATDVAGYPLLGGKFKNDKFSISRALTFSISPVNLRLSAPWSADNSFNINMPHKTEHRH